jgi:phage shock protein PspC (stress-responsive transcriptional regulator)
MSENEINEPRPDPEPGPDPDEPRPDPDEPRPDPETPPAGEPHDDARPGPRPPRRLLRSRGDRMIAGVAGGLGEYYGVDPVIVRIAFAVSVFFGGLGALAYLALGLFVPSAAANDGDQVGPAPVERSRGLAIAAGAALLVIALSWGIFDFGGGFFGWGPFWLGPPLLLIAAIALVVWVARGTGGGPTSVLGRVALAIGALIALSLLAVTSAWAGATGHGVIVASLIVAIGALLLVAAFRGGARWLVIPALALAAPLGFVSAADISFGDGIGERVYRPATVTVVPEDGYELGVGRLLVDLRELDWRPNTAIDLDVDLGIGEAVIGVPSDVCVTADLDSAAGEIRVAGEEQDGVDVHTETKLGANATPRLDLTGEVDLGALRLINDDDADLDRSHGRFEDDADDDTMREDLGRACASGGAKR